MESHIQQLEEYIKKILTNKIAEENDKEKNKTLIKALNDLIINKKQLENIICLEFANREDKIFIVRCSKSFCINKNKCHSNTCSIFDFIGYNPDASEYLFKKIEEKINRVQPGYLKDNTLYDYIGNYLGNDGSFFDVMIINDHIILNEEI